MNLLRMIFLKKNWNYILMKKITGQIAFLGKFSDKNCTGYANELDLL